VSYTKGPWKAKELIRDSTGASDWVILGPRDRGVERRIDANGKFDKDNAHIIAASPDLLDALKVIVECTSGFGNDLDWHQVTLQVCRDAIAKAEGKETC